MLKLGKTSNNSVFKRYFSAVTTPTYVLENLNKKSLMTIVGEEAQTYLQGLITNDINHLSNNCSSLYAMFLNSKGRILYDAIIYRIDPKTYFVECDSALVHSLEKHLKMYRLRRKIDVFLSDYKIHVMFDKKHFDEILKSKDSSCCPKQSDVDLSGSDKKSPLKIYRDPRISQLGYRILSQEGTDVKSQLSESFNIDINQESDLSYKKCRYSLGIGEGSVDLPSGNCFPLESNCDYLHGVSFHKGCYIGQELTARTYHTGVTRKRLLPLFFNEPPVDLHSQDLISVDNMKLGKLRGLEGNVGLALLRLESLEKINSSITFGGIEAVVSKPFWWPIEAPKDKMGLRK